MVGAMLVLAVVGVLWTPYDPLAVQPAHRLAGSSWEHWFGTDRYGRDVFSQIMAGAHRSIGVGLGATLIAAGVGVPLGLVAAWRGGWLAQVIMRGTDMLIALPALLLAIVATAIWGSSTWTAIVALGIANIAIFLRIVRVATLQVLSQDYVRAALDAGKSASFIAWRHVLPNIVPLLVAQAAITFALAILAEAGLSFLGLGTPPPLPSWGRMLQAAQSSLATAPHLALWPGLAIAWTVLGLHFFSDGVRARFTPATSQRSKV